MNYILKMSDEELTLLRDVIRLVDQLEGDGTAEAPTYKMRSRLASLVPSTMMEGFCDCGKLLMTFDEKMSGSVLIICPDCEKSSSWMSVTNIGAVNPERLQDGNQDTII
jgi:hypothetical protein